MEINIEATIKAESHTVRENTLGRMEHTTKDNSTKEWEREKDHGLAKTVTNTKATTVLIAKTAMESSNGPMATSTKANSAKICAKAKAKCNGTTKAYTQANGEEVFPTVKVLIPITKSGMFKAKDEKPRFGIFEDNILIKESKNKMYYSRN